MMLTQRGRAAVFHQNMSVLADVRLHTFSRGNVRLACMYVCMYECMYFVLLYVNFIYGVAVGGYLL
jgi:hypothetical protein